MEKQKIASFLSASIESAEFFLEDNNLYNMSNHFYDTWKLWNGYLLSELLGNEHNKVVEFRNILARKEKKSFRQATDILISVNKQRHTYY